MNEEQDKTFLELLQQSNFEMYAAIKRVRELHYPVIDTHGLHCGECSDTDFGHYIDYPCSTIKATDGEQ